MREQEQNYLSIFFVFICVLGGRKEQKENKKRTKRVKKKKKNSGNVFWISIETLINLS